MWFWYLIAGLWLVDIGRIRSRFKAIHVLEPSDATPTDEYDFLVNGDVQIDEGTRRAACAFARSQNLDLLDIIPSNLPALDAICIIQYLDPKTYRGNRVARGYTSGYAMLVSKDLLTRARVKPCGPWNSVEFIDSATRLKRFARDRADLCISSSLRTSDSSPLNQWPAFERAFGGMANIMFMMRGIVLALIVAGLFVAPAAGVTALAAFHFQILLGTAGLAIHPRHRLIVFLFRTPLEAWLWLKTIVERMSQKKTVDPIAVLRPRYQALLAEGTDRFFLPRRDDCALCGSRDLFVRLRTTDIVQGKPGRFHLEECRACGHIFQNPCLSPEGLDFYYRDFYDGLGAGPSEALFRSRPAVYQERARVVEKFLRPGRWLDVGTGHGHFCCVAKSTWPETRFDGLDISDGVDEALQAGWIDQGFHGLLPDVARQLEGNYDVVSLFHCLEHTPDPPAEIDSAHIVLAPNGLLIIEVPNPECILGRIFGRFWLPWFQPQHLHLFSIKNLEKLLRQRGFEPLLTQTTEAHIKLDMFCFIMMLYGWLGPKPDVPWKPAPSWASRLRYFLVWRLAFPVLPIFWLLDLAAGPLFRSSGISNTYRMVARRVATGEGFPSMISSAHSSAGTAATAAH